LLPYTTLFRSRPAPACDRVGPEADVVQVEVGVRSVLPRDHYDAATAPPDVRRCVTDAGKRWRTRDRRDRVEVAEQRGSGRHLLGWEPPRELLLERRPEPGHRRVGIDVHTRLGTERAVRGRDAGTAVDEGEIEVETDYQGKHQSSVPRHDRRPPVPIKTVDPCHRLAPRRGAGCGTQWQHSSISVRSRAK